jgi:phage baseplate assembly protein W
MPTFKGFNTIGQYKKFGMVDFALIKRDLLNAFSIREGEMPGRPTVGTSIWSFIFEPIDNIMLSQCENEVRRVIKQDPRLDLVSIDISSDENTVTIEVMLNILPGVDPEVLYLQFNEETQTVAIT